MPISFGRPGDLRKTFNDGIFDLVGGVYHKNPCALAATVDIANEVKDGLFLAPDGNGKFKKAADANRSLYMVFTAHTERVLKIVTEADEFPGEDRTDTVTGLAGEILGFWPTSLLFVGDKDGNPVVLADYKADTALTVFEGKLAPAAAGEKVVGHVEAPVAVVGASSIAARLNL